MRVLSTSRSVILLAVVPLVACGSPPAPAAPSEASTVSAPVSASASAPTPMPRLARLEKTDVVVGTGAEAKSGAAVSVHYTGRLVDGTVFDSSIERGKPFSFILGNGGVIRGWELGVVGMKVGGKRHLVIPPHLGYGDRGSPPTIPPGATLEFDIELIHVVD